MSVVDLSSKRWDCEDDPAKHKPAEALHAALRAIDDDVVHVLVLFASKGDSGGVNGCWYQAGSYNLHGQLGMLNLAATQLIES